jgi:hypothetical protein
VDHLCAVFPAFGFAIGQHPRPVARLFFIAALKLKKRMVRMPVPSLIWQVIIRRPPKVMLQFSTSPSTVA